LATRLRRVGVGDVDGRGVARDDGRAEARKSDQVHSVPGHSRIHEWDRGDHFHRATQGVSGVAEGLEDAGAYATSGGHFGGAPAGNELGRGSDWIGRGGNLGVLAKDVAACASVDCGGGRKHGGGSRVETRCDDDPDEVWRIATWDSKTGVAEIDV